MPSTPYRPPDSDDPAAKAVSVADIAVYGRRRPVGGRRLSPVVSKSTEAYVVITVLVRTLWMVSAVETSTVLDTGTESPTEQAFSRAEIVTAAGGRPLTFVRAR